MALYEFAKDSMVEIPTTTFALLGLREREDVQRVLREHIDAISPNTLILAEEYGEWEDSKRRIDLLGLDRGGYLVVIELKRTEDGGHMELQALRYAALVSIMTFDQAVEARGKYLEARGLSSNTAESSIREHLDVEDGPVAFGNQVRIVLASAEFSKEITSSVLWLNDQGLDIRCVRMRPHHFQDRVLLDVQQVIPLPEAAAYQVAIRKKNSDKADADAEANANGRDYTRYTVHTNQGEAFSNLPKRRFIYQVVKLAIGRGLTPLVIARAVPWRSNMFISAPGNLSGDQLMDASPGSDRNRYFCNDDEVFHLDGRTYAMSKNWGRRTEKAVQYILGVLPPAHGIRYEAMP
ncbi:MAG: hypothetical protein ORN29_08045 [Rhodoferax sp.]|nr:hypothetical protein [Rhodoferax sp.]